MQLKYTGTFEAHITVNAIEAIERAIFAKLCQKWGIKCVIIELPCGISKNQPMTASIHRGTLNKVLQEVKQLAQKIIAEGLAVTRIKIEAMVSNQDIPKSDDEAKALPATNYFEFHVKTTLAADADLEALKQFCWQYNAHLSTNALRYLKDGYQQRFITMRLYQMGLFNARSTFKILLDALKAKNLKLDPPQLEYTVYDSNSNLDAGWFRSSRE